MLLLYSSSAFPLKAELSILFGSVSFKGNRSFLLELAVLKYFGVFELLRIESIQMFEIIELWAVNLIPFSACIFI